MDVLAARGELAAKTTYQRAAKGAIAVSECPPDGKCVKIENTGRRVNLHCMFTILSYVLEPKPRLQTII